MPAGSRVRANNVYGTVSDNPLLAAAVSFTSLGLSLLPAISGQHAVVVLDPKRVFGEPEIVVVTSHLAMGTSATIVRAQYGTTARDHPQGTAWAHVPVGPDDYTAIVTSGTRPSNPYAGQTIFETDTNRFVSRDAANSVWERQAWTASAGRTGVSVTTGGQNIPDATETAVSWTAETFDSDGFITTPNTTFTIPAGLGGLYSITVRLRLPADPTVSAYQYITAATVAYLVPSGGALGRAWFTMSIIVPLVAASTVSYTLFQDHTGAQTTSSGELHMYRIGP